MILSGGPDSVYRRGRAPGDLRRFSSSGSPVLGICYGMQWMMRELGGRVEPADEREYGPATVKVTDRDSLLFRGLDPRRTSGPATATGCGSRPRASSTLRSQSKAPRSPPSRTGERRLFGVQFHPEVVHTPTATEILRNFLFEHAHVAGTGQSGRSWRRRSRMSAPASDEGRVICALSGGVDSSVMALLLHRALGDRLTCIFVNNGVLRKNEASRYWRRFRERFHLEVRYADAAERFLERLAGVEDPERKRKVIGETFIEVFEAEADAGGRRVPGPGDDLSRPHRVGVGSRAVGDDQDAPQRRRAARAMKLKLVEPLRDLFKDEVRRVGRALGLGHAFVQRHPFPGPGLAVRILGEVTAERVALLQAADAIFIEELRAAGLYEKTAQAFVVLLPVKTVGVMGDWRTYEHVVALTCRGDHRFHDRRLGPAAARVPRPGVRAGSSTRSAGSTASSTT